MDLVRLSLGQPTTDVIRSDLSPLNIRLNESTTDVVNCDSLERRLVESTLVTINAARYEWKPGRL